MSNDLAKDRAARLLKKQGSATSLGLSGNKHATIKGMPPEDEVALINRKRSISSVSHADDPEPSKPSIRLENTYQLGPSSRFPVTKIEQVLKDVVDSYLAEERYEPELCREMSKTIAEVVRNRVKELKVMRYKVVAVITIGMLNDQGFSVASRCLWDPQIDSYASYEFRNNSLYAVATIFGVYQD